MPDKTYCYPNSDVLINKLNIRNQADLFEAEKELTYIRLKELQVHPIKGKFDFKHLKDIHKYIFQDLYYGKEEKYLKILTSDDLTIKDSNSKYDYYCYENYKDIQLFDDIYNERISKMKKK